MAFRDIEDAVGYKVEFIVLKRNVILRSEATKNLKRVKIRRYMRFFAALRMTKAKLPTERRGRLFIRDVEDAVPYDFLHFWNLSLLQILCVV